MFYYYKKLNATGVVQADTENEAIRKLNSRYCPSAYGVGYDVFFPIQFDESDVGEVTRMGTFSNQYNIYSKSTEFSRQ